MAFLDLRRSDDVQRLYNATIAYLDGPVDSSYTQVTRPWMRLFAKTLLEATSMYVETPR